MARTYGSGEAVTLNFNPLLSQAMLEQRQQAAQNAALQKAIQDDLNKVKSDGIRTQDTEAYTTAYQKMKDAAINYQAISSTTKNPLQRAKAYNDFQESLLGVKNIINESKNAAKVDQETGKFYLTNHDKVDMPSFMAYRQGKMAPIGSPEYESVKGKDITSVLWNPGSFDSRKFNLGFSDLTPKLTRTPVQMPDGRVLYTNKYIINPEAVANRTANYFDEDLFNSKKYFTSLYDNSSPEEINRLESYAKKYMPDFTISDPKSFAVASMLMNKGIEQDAGQQYGGSAYLAQQQFQREQQQRSFNHQDALFSLREQNKDKRAADKDHFIVNDIASGIINGDKNAVIKPFQAAALPGGQVLHIQNGEGTDADRNKLLNALKIYGVDGKSKNPSKKDLDAGIYVMTIPDINPKTKQPYVVKSGHPELGIKYKMMVLSGADKNPAYRANQALQFISGNPKGKSLPGKFKEVLPATVQQEDVEDEELNDDENFDQ